MSVSFLLGLVYLISESRKGIAEIEGKATRVGVSECGQGANFNCCRPIRQAQGRLNRKESERFKAFTYEELTKRDKHSITHRTCPASLDTLKVSVPPAVKLAAASANLDIFVSCYFGCSSAPVERSGRLSQRGGYSGNPNHEG